MNIPNTNKNLAGFVTVIQIIAQKWHLKMLSNQIPNARQWSPSPIPWPKEYIIQLSNCVCSGVRVVYPKQRINQQATYINNEINFIHHSLGAIDGVSYLNVPNFCRKMCSIFASLFEFTIKQKPQT